MKKIIAILLGIELLIIAGIFGFEFQDKKNTNEDKLGATILYPYQGGTGTGTAPTYGQMLVGNSGGTYTLTATSSLGITAAGDGASNWNKQTNYGVLNLTASTTIPYWAKDAFYASSTSVFQGLATFGNASTTQISATNSYVGTVLSGIWNGTALGNAYVDDDITLTNLTQITNRAISDTTGTLTVARGGTGQTSFGQGWLHSDGTTFTSSTSPTVAWLTATSTTATSTFAGGLKSDKAVQFPLFANCNIDTDADGFLVCGSDATGSSVGTVSTSSTPTIGNLAYWTSTAYPSLLGTVATTTPTLTAPLTYSGTLGSFVGGVAGAFDCTSATGSVKGCLTSTDWTTFNGKQAGDATLTALAGLTISAGSLITGTGADAFSVLAGGTNGYVLAMSGSAPAWVATTTLSTISGTLDISAQSNLTCGTNCTLTGDDISVDDAFILNTGDIGTGAYDFGGATSFEIPNGASPTVDATGEIAIDTTSDQLVFYGASEKKQIVPFYTTGFSYATTSWTGTTTLFMAPAMAAQTWNTAKCETSVGTLNVVVNDGTNNSNLLNASTTIGTFTLSSNNAFTSSETIRVDIGTPASSPVKIACRFKYVYDAD